MQDSIDDEKPHDEATHNLQPIFSCVRAYLNEDRHAGDEIERMKNQINSNCFKEEESKFENILSKVFNRYENSLSNIDTINTSISKLKVKYDNQEEELKNANSEF